MKFILPEFPFPTIAMIPMLMFFAFFCGMLIYVSTSRSKKLFESVSHIPLEEEHYE